MKKNLLFLLMAVFALSFTACSDDDDDDTLAKSVEGTYAGDLNVNVGGTDTEIKNKEIGLKATGDNTITLSLKDFTFMNMNVGDIVIPNVIVSEEKDPKAGVFYGLKGSAKITLKILTLDMEVTVTIDKEGSYILGKKIGLVLTIDGAKLPTGQEIPVSVDFEGVKK